MQEMQRRALRQRRNDTLSTGLRPLALAVGLSAALGALPPAVDSAHAQEKAAATQRYDLPAGPLDATLTRIARQAGRIITIDPQLVSGLQAAPVQGELSLEQAFSRALAGTGLSLSVSENGTLGLRRARPGGGETTLAPMTVTAGILRDATSEDTRSYAARATTIGKTTQTLREIPQSVTVVTRQRMDDQNLTSVTEALRSATGVIATGYFDQETPSARGYAMNEQHDGVPQQGGASGLAPDLAIYDRVEILRGASGLLSGSGEPGGAVNYVRKRPQTAFGANASLSTGSWDNHRAEVDVNLPLAADGALRGRVVGAYQDRDFFYDVAHSRRSTLFATLEYDLAPQTTIGVSHTNVERNGHSFWGLPTYTDGEFIESRSAFVGPDRNYLMKIEETSADFKHRFDNGWEARAAVTRRTHRFDGYGAYNSSGGIDPVTGLGSLAIGHIQSTTQRDGGDIGFNGPLQLLGRTHTLAFGYNKAIQDYEGGARYVTVPDVDLLNRHDFGDLVPTTIPSKSQTVTEQSGYYGMGRFKLADPLTLVLGGRWTDYESKSRRAQPARTAWTTGDAGASDQFTPYGGLIWDLNRQLSLYASYADIFVPQSDIDFNGRTLDPRLGWQAEAGVKGELFDGALNASLAIFRIRDENRPMVDDAHVGCGGTPTGTCYVAAGLVQSQGWEAEVSGSPVRGLELSAGYTYNETEYLRDGNAANVGRPFNSATPRHLLKLWSHYRFDDRAFDGMLAGWSVGAGVHAQSEIYFGTTTATVKRREQPGYFIASILLNYEIDKHWNASLRINNLFDRKYFALVSGTGFANIYGEPRNAMLTLRYDY